MNEADLRLLIVEGSEHDAVSLANVLSNAGYPVRFDHARDAATFEAALNAGAPDIVLCGTGTGTMDTNTVLDILAQHTPAPPVIVISKEAPETAVVAAKMSGAAAMVSNDQPAHLLWAIERETALLRLRNRAAALETALASCEERCYSLMEDSGDAVACVHEGMHCFANRPYMELFGIVNREEIEGTPVLDMISAGQRGTFREFLRNFQDGETAVDTLGISCTGKDGVDFDSTMEFTRASIGGEPCTQIIIRTDHCVNTALEEKIRTMARQDGLTGLYNRQHFMSLLECACAKPGADGDVRALFYIRLDRFREIREAKGIAASDTVLCDIARLLEKRCSGKDSIARFGDYSYTILSQAGSIEEVRTMGDMLLDDVSMHISEVQGQAITVSCSIGICEIGGHMATAQKILSQADTACEVARSSGGNRIHTHRAVIDGQMSEALEKEWDKVIRKTIDEERFYLAYQPVVSLAGDAGKRYEALLRIVDEEGDTILPGQFLAIAEKSGFIAEIDYWVLDTAFRKIAELGQNGDEITIFLKLSGTVLADTDLPAWICSKLKEYHVAGSSVIFEITEINAANGLKGAISFIKAMEKLQCRVALEHYGINNKPQLLKHVRADFLKIDGRLIENLAGNREDQSRVSELIRFAHKNNKQCIAEYVDNPETLALLWQYGVDLIQGNFVQEPARELAYDFEGEIA